MKTGNNTKSHIFFVLFAFFLFCVIGTFTIRHIITQKLERKGVKDIVGLHFNFPNSISADKIVIQPQNKQTIIITGIRGAINPFSATYFNTLSFDSLMVHSNSSTKEKQPTTIQQKIAVIKDTMKKIGTIDSDVSIGYLKYRGTEIENIFYHDNKISFSKIHLKNKPLSFQCNATLNNENILIELSKSDTNQISFDSIYMYKGISLSFDTLLLNIGNSNDTLLTNLSLKQCAIEHFRIADTLLTIDTIGLHLNIVTNNTTFQLLEGSNFTINRVQLPFTLINKIDTVHTLSLIIPETKLVATDILNALPHSNLPKFGVDLSGHLTFKAELFLSSIYDSITFNYQLKKCDDFKINNLEKCELNKLNRGFTQKIFENNNYVRSKSISVGAKGYTPYSGISKNMINALIQFEDASFFGHRGVVVESLRESIIENLKQKRFVRGGSTITMQLVKNAFLSRDKTMVRKLDEMFIVWLIENMKITSKEKMLEIYLNIIEWGPNIYGITEASNFYFRTTPDNLSLQQSLFLASIVPRPKKFKNYFERNGSGKIKKGYIEIYQFVLNEMITRKMVTDIDTTNFSFHINITGPALKYLPKASVTDTITIDTSEIE